MAKEKIKVSKDDLKKGLKNAKGELGAFKEFISKGNVVDMAVGVIIGGAFGKIVTSLVNDIIMPLIGLLIGGLDFSGLAWEVKDAKITYGAFIQTVVDFLIVAFCIFAVIRMFERFKNRLEKSKEDEKSAEDAVEEVKKSDETVLLEEIRDLLKEKNSK